MPTPSDPYLESAASAAARSSWPSGELEQELQAAVDEIARGEFVVLSVDAVDGWTDTGVAPWPDDFPG